MSVPCRLCEAPDQVDALRAKVARLEREANRDLAREVLPVLKAALEHEPISQLDTHDLIAKLERMASSGSGGD